MVDDIGSITAAANGETYTSTFMYKGTTKVYDVLVPVFEDGKHIGAIDIGFSMDSVDTTVKQVILFIISISLVSLIIATTILLKISLGITRPLKILVDAARNIAEGDLTQNIEVKSHDEIGVLFQSFNTMKEHLKNTLISIKAGASEVKSMSTTLNSNAKQMTLASGEVSNAIQEVAKGAESQAKELVDVSNHVSRLGSELDSINSKIEGVKASTDTTEEKATIGKQQMDHLLTTIEEVQKSFMLQANLINDLNESVSKVSNITNFISEISNQTNLLALNAAIEAARAGEEGKGFAVVADQIRKLAAQSQTSVKNIAHQIEQIKESIASAGQMMQSETQYVQNGISLVQESKIAFEDIAKKVFELVNGMTEVVNFVITVQTSSSSVAGAVQRIASVIEESGADIEEVTASTEEQASISEEISRSALELSNMAEELLRAVSVFKV